MFGQPVLIVVTVRVKSLDIIDMRRDSKMQSFGKLVDDSAHAVSLELLVVGKSRTVTTKWAAVAFCRWVWRGLLVQTSPLGKVPSRTQVSSVCFFKAAPASNTMGLAAPKRYSTRGPRRPLAPIASDSTSNIKQAAQMEHRPKQHKMVAQRQLVRPAHDALAGLGPWPASRRPGRRPCGAI